MSAEIFLNGRVQLCCGDSLHFLRDQPDGRYDSVVTDPPYALVSITKRYGAENAKASPDVYGRGNRGFMGKKWDTGETAFAVEFWQQVFRVLKPGGHVVAFGGTRTSHRLACAIEDAGFEIRDQLQWLYGSGFPKSHDVSKGIDKASGAKGQKGSVVGKSGSIRNSMAGDFAGGEYHEYLPSTDLAREWQGWGTALKPSCEPICLARKPLIGTVAQNVLQHGTGAINIDGCRVGTDDKWSPSTHGASDSIGTFKTGIRIVEQSALGRWPANILHDGSDEVIAAFPDTNPSTIGKPRGAAAGDGWGMTATGAEYDDSGSAARFFYSAKADSDDRLGSKHPTVKPVDLMQWLVRLVTPKGGLVLDPFAGTGTTAEACFREGMRCMLVERETEYQADIRRRMALVLGGPEERRRAGIKAKNFPIDHGPLFEAAE
jgi:DNA modification methylase